MIPEHDDILARLRVLEPLIYAANDGRERAWFEALLEPDFWEVGASGQVYSRAFVLDTLAERQRNPRQEAWSTGDYQLKAMAPGLYLVTYELRQPTRVSRRATVWRQAGPDWRMVYHQGTVVDRP